MNDREHIEKLRETYHTKEPEIVGLAKAMIYFSSLRYVRRYSKKPLIIEQNVMEHCGGVSTLGCLYIVLEAPELDLEEKYEFLVKLILHDLHEAVTGDVIYTVKRVDKEAEEAYNRAAKKGIEKVMNFMKYSSGVNITHRQKNVMPILTGECSYKGETFVDQLVEFFDRLEMLIYIAEEERMGNRNLVGIRHTVEKMLLYDLLSDVDIIYEEFVSKLRQLAASVMSHSWQSDALNDEREDYV